MALELTDRQAEKITDDVVEKVCDLLGIEEETTWERINETLGSEIVQALRSFRVSV